MESKSAHDFLFRRKGFTLIELLITITIISLITAATIPSFVGYLKNQGVSQAQAQVLSDLRNVQNKALTGAMSDQLIGGSLIQYWGVKFTSGSSAYQYFVSVNTTCPALPIPANQAQGSASLTPDLQVKSTTCVFFSLSDGSATGASPIKVGYADGTGTCHSVVFNSNGLIYSNSSTGC